MLHKHEDKLHFKETAINTKTIKKLVGAEDHHHNKA